MLATLSVLDIAVWRCGESSRLGAGLWLRCLDRNALARGYALSLVVLAAAVICLVSDLGRPDRFYMAIVRPTVSVLTFGSFSLSAAVISAVAMFALANFRLSWISPRVITCAEVVSIASGVATAGYTGVFLFQVDFISSWNNPVLPLLFLLSSFSAGISGVVLGFRSVAAKRYLGIEEACLRADKLIVLGEAIAAIAYIVILWGSDDGALVGFANAESFCSLCAFVLLGLLFPLLSGPMGRLLGIPVPTVVYCLSTIFGSFFLRHCIVNAAFSGIV